MYRGILLFVIILRVALSDDPLAAAKSLARDDKFKEAEQITREYLKSNSDSADGHYLLGYILFRQAKARESLGEYTEGAKYRKPNAFDLRVVGADYVILGDFTDADKWFTKSLEWEPNNALGWYYLGRTKYNENRFEEAISAFERCLKLEPQNVKAEDNLGLSLQALGRSDDALQAYKNAIAWQADAPPATNPAPLIDIGGLFLERNEPEKAIGYLHQAVEIAPGSAKAHSQLGKAYFALKDFPKAQSELEKSIDLAPSDAPAHYVLGQIYQKQGLNDKANQQFTRYTELNGTQSTREPLETYPLTEPRP